MLSVLAALCTQESLSNPLPRYSPLSADLNKNHSISKVEFRKSLAMLLSIPDKDIDMIIPRFFENGSDALSYDTFMSQIHLYSDKVIRAQ